MSVSDTAASLPGGAIVPEMRTGASFEPFPVK